MYPDADAGRRRSRANDNENDACKLCFPGLRMVSGHQDVVLGGLWDRLWMGMPKADAVQSLLKEFSSLRTHGMNV
jgi:hypothetical protein